MAKWDNDARISTTSRGGILILDANNVEFGLQSSSAIGTGGEQLYGPAPNDTEHS